MSSTFNDVLIWFPLCNRREILDTNLSYWWWEVRKLCMYNEVKNPLVTGLLESIIETICQINLPDDSISSIGNAQSSENCHYIVGKVESALVSVWPKAKKQLVERVLCGTQNNHLCIMWWDECIQWGKSRRTSKIMLAWSPHYYSSMAQVGRSLGMRPG